MFYKEETFALSISIIWGRIVEKWPIYNIENIKLYDCPNFSLFCLEEIISKKSNIKVSNIVTFSKHDITVIQLIFNINNENTKFSFYLICKEEEEEEKKLLIIIRRFTKIH